jgi:hypothetical protein
MNIKRVIERADLFVIPMIRWKTRKEPRHPIDFRIDIVEQLID